MGTINTDAVPPIVRTTEIPSKPDRPTRQYAFSPMPPVFFDQHKLILQDTY